MQPNKFKTTFIKFIENFDLKCNAENISNLQTVQIYHKDKKRSLKILALFVKSLQEIEKMLLSPNKTNQDDDIDTDITMKQLKEKENEPIGSLNVGLVSKQRAQQQALHSSKSLFPSHAQMLTSNASYHNNNDTTSLSSHSTQSSVSPCSSVIGSVLMNEQNPSTNPLSFPSSTILPQIPISIKSSLFDNSHIKQPVPYHNNLNNISTNLPMHSLSTGIKMNQATKIHKFNPYSIYVPLHRNYTLKYQFLSFSPLRVKKIMIISNRSSV